MVSYARIPQGKVGRYSGKEGEIGGLCVSPVSGHAVIVIKGKRNGKTSLSLIHYSKYTPTHTLNAERNSFEKSEPMSVYVYFNHLKTNPNLIAVLHTRLQETNIEHVLREFPEKQKGLIATFESTSTFDADDDKVDITSHERHADIKKYHLLNAEFRLLQGLVRVGQLTVDGKISHAPGEGKYIKYDGDIYRHPSELADKLTDPLDCTSLIFDDEFQEAGSDDVQLCAFASEVIKDIPKAKCVSEAALAEQLNKTLTSRTHMASPRALSTTDHPFFGGNLVEAAKVLVSTSVFSLANE